MLKKILFFLVLIQCSFAGLGIFYFVLPLLPIEIIFPFDKKMIPTIIFICLSVLSIIQYLVLFGFDATVKKIITVNLVAIFAICASILVLDYKAMKDLIIAICTLFLLISWCFTIKKQLQNNIFLSKFIK